MSRHDIDEQHVIIVGGAPRSGTTLVQRVLAAHPDIYGGPEFDLLPSIVELWKNFRLSIVGGRIDSYFSELECSQMFKEFVLALLGGKAGREGKKFVSEKTPSNVIVFSDLIELLPRSKYIFVLRDPRSIVASMKRVRERYLEQKRKPPYFVAHTYNSIEYIKKCWDGGFRAYDKHDNVRIVYYEDLVRNPEETASLLLAFIGLPFRDEMLQIQGKRIETASTRTTENWHTPGQMTEGIANDRTMHWKEVLSSYDLYLIKKYLKVRRKEIERYFPLAPTGVVGADLFNRLRDGIAAMRRETIKNTKSMGQRLLKTG